MAPAQTIRRSARRPILHALLGLALLAAMGAANPGGPGSQPLVIQEITWGEFGLVVKASGPIEPDIFKLNGPDRFVIDLPNAELADATLAQTIAVDKGAIKQVRLAQKDNQAVRMVIDCASPTHFQLMQGRDRSTLVIVPPGVNSTKLAALLKGGEGYTGGGQELGNVWASETRDQVKLNLRGGKGLTYTLFEEDSTHYQLRLPQGRLVGMPPKTGKLLEKIVVNQADGSLMLSMALADGHYHLGEELSQDGSTLTLTWDKVNPRRFPGRPLVVIDPGHGGADPGALGPNKVKEKEVNLALALALQKALLAKRYNAILTRSADTEMYLAPRLGLIDRHKADLFVSLHANSHVTSDSSGVETYWREPLSLPLAQAIQRQVTSMLSRPDRGVKQERLYVIRHPRVPSILLETGFISNPTEETLLGDAGFQGQAANAIVHGIESYMATPAQALRSDRPVAVEPKTRAERAVFAPPTGEDGKGRGPKAS